MGHDEHKQRSKRVWGTGDYGPTSRQLEPASIALVESLGIAAGHQVLDVAAGDGNCAIAAARRGAAVCATDFSGVMVEAGRARSQGEGLRLSWREADAADLPFENASFDRYTSVFGVIFAPEREAVAAEAVRVTRPGGRLGLTAWTADGFTARLMEIARRHGPPRAPGAPDPLRWGRPGEATRIFAALGCTVDVRPRALTFRYSSWDGCMAAFEAHGMAVVARQTLPANDYAGLVDEIQALIAERNHGVSGAVAYNADYLEVLVTKP